jgi:hypothetical protein
MPSLFDANDPPPGLPMTASGIYFEIESCTVRDNWVPRANQTTANTRVAYAGSELWITDMVGKVTVTYPASGAGATLRRQVPYQSPYPVPGPLAPGTAAIGGQWCTRVEGIDQGGDPEPANEGPRFDGVTGWPVPKWVRYRCTFEGLPYAVLTDAQTDLWGGPTTGAELQRYVIRSRRARKKEQQVPMGGWYFVPGAAVPANKVPGTTWFKNTIQADVQYVWVRVPVQRLNVANLKAALNTVNFGPWDLVPGGYAWDPGTLLFVGWDDADRYFDANGDWVADVVFYFDHKDLGLPLGAVGGPRAGWQWFLNPLGNPVQVSSDGTTTGQLPYPSSDFNLIFTVQ